jgi:NTP pyrophosphatase (non-canonical NTP hydrolase)
MSTETWESIAAWCDETFGPASPLRMASRANEEMAELIDVASRSETYSEKVLIEAADVVICLARFPGIWAAVEQKMAINRSRVWRLTGEGTGYHIAQPLSGNPNDD